MSILRGSRYQGVPFTGIKTLDGKTRKFLHDRRIFSAKDIGTNSIEYVVQGEEELDSIADKFYDDETLWWLIADVNDIEFAFDVAPGDIIIVPARFIVTSLLR